MDAAPSPGARSEQRSDEAAGGSHGGQDSSTQQSHDARTRGTHRASAPSSRTSSRAPSRPSSSHDAEHTRHASAPGNAASGSRNSRRHGTSKQPVRVGQYTLLQTLGTGSFGKVRLAIHSLTGHRVAMKFINRRKISSMDMGARVKREIQYLKLLRHPHIIKLYEVITTPTDIIMVIEYAGGELFQYIVERGRMSEDEGRRFFQQIICAIEYCHRHKIVHRDLKPENLLLDDHLNVKIGDFGLSNIMTDGDFLKTSCGSPNYAAPEVISGKLYAGPEIDIWSCGVILYVMLCGRLPFDDDYIPTLFKKINGGIYTLPSYLSEEAKHLLSSMLIVDPVKRITISEIRQSPWFQKDLPTYLQPLPPTPAAESAGFNFNTIDETAAEKDAQSDIEAHLVGAPDIGIVEDDIVTELASKMAGFGPEEVRKQLMESGDNQVKVAYHLVRDHKRMMQYASLDNKDDMASFLAQSPPPWNAGMDDMVSRSTSIRNKERRHPSEQTRASVMAQTTSDAPGDETVFSEQEIGSVTDEMGTEAGQSDEEDSATDYDDLFLEDDEDDDAAAKLNGIAILAPSVPSLRAAEETPSLETACSAAAQDNVVPTRRTRSRWHFGIRSRSPPMEIMLELYRTLQVLGMEWREKPFDRKPAPVDEESDTKRGAGGKKSKHHEHFPQSEELFFVETRWTINNVIVRMNLQLYRVDESNYLVDFRYVGCQVLEYSPEQPNEEVRRLPSSSSRGPADQEHTAGPSLARESGPSSVIHSPADAAAGTSVRASSEGTPAQSPSSNALDSNSLHSALETAYKQSSESDRPASAQSGTPARKVAVTPKVSRNATPMAMAPMDGSTDVCSPFLFLECATRLIIELAGGG